MISGIEKIWNKLPWQAILLIFGLIFFWRSQLMPMSGDDYAYAFIWNSEHGGNLLDDIGPRQRLESLGDIVISQWNHYFSWGGRTFSMLIIQFFAWQEKAGFALCNTLVYLLLMLVLYWLAMGKIISPAKAKGCFLWVIIGLNFGVLDYITTMIWMTGTCVYMWTGLWECGLLLPYALAYRNREFGRNWPKWAWLLMALLGLLAGWSQEGGSLVTITLLGMASIAIRHREGKLSPWMLAGVGGAVIGCMLLILAPGSIMREEYMLEYEADYVLPVQQLFTHAMFYRNFTEGFLPVILWEAFLFLPLLLYFMQREKKRGDKSYIIAFLLAGLEILVLMMFSPEFKVHTGFHSTMFLTIASAAALKECVPYLRDVLQNSLLWRRLALGTGIIAFVYVVLSFVGALYVENSYAQQWQDRKVYVNEHRQDDEIVVSALYIPDNLDEWLGPRSLTIYHLIYGADLEYKPTDNRSNIFAQYYGLKSIRIDREFDWEKYGGTDN